MTAVTTTSWELDAELVLATVLERRARSNPDRLFAKIPQLSTSYSGGFRPVTNSEVLNAVNNVSWLLEGALGKGVDFPTIAYLGPLDLQYSIMVFAAIKTGYKVFLPSPRNSMVAFNALLTKLECQTLVTTTPEPAAVPMILSKLEIRKIVLPYLMDLLDRKDVPEYRYEKSFEMAKSDPFLVLHTSGSTGIPKPLIYTNEFMSRVAKNVSLVPPRGFRSLDVYVRSGAFFIFLPPFHVAGIAFSLIVPTFYQDAIPIYPLSAAPPTVASLLEATKYTHSDWAFVAPSMVDEIGDSPALLDAFSEKFKHLFYSGGAVPKVSGDMVASRMGLFQILGSSECGHFPLIREEADQSCQAWDSICVHPALNAELQHRFDDLHELVLVRKDDRSNHQPVFLHFPELQSYETRDLFVATGPNQWTHVSRLDDVVVFLNGEKTNPITFEQELGRHPEVRSALVAGMQRFEASLLIELADYPKSTVKGEAEVIERLWPMVEKANSVTPAHARVAKSKIVIVDPSKPMLRAGKGTVQRQATWKLYNDELEAMYAADEIAEAETLPEVFDVSNTGHVSLIVREAVTRLMQREEIGMEDGFFNLGMDSLMVLRLTRELKVRLKLASIDTQAVYRNPSVEMLTAGIVNMAASGDSGALKNRETLMNEMLDIFKAQIDGLASTTKKTRLPGDNNAKTSVVLLTGSTGAVGSYLLTELLETDSVSRVYCLNRAKDSKALQLKRNAERGLPTEFPPNRVTFLSGTLSEPDFGLSKSILMQLSLEVTHIVLNAWPVNFNLQLQSFRSSLDNVSTMIAFAAGSPVSPSITFVSSISAMTNYSGSAIPEQITSDLSSPANMGYGESKYVAERMLDYASQKLNIQASIVRVGQVGGTADRPRGWNRNEWLPSLVISSNHLRALPDSLGTPSATAPDGMMGTIDWIPIDRLAGILMDLILSGDGGVYHAVNPRTVSWAELVPYVRERLGQDIKVVPFEKWLDALKIEADKHNDADFFYKNPGTKLIDFYEGLLQAQGSARFSTERSIATSGRLRDLESIKPEWISGWVRKWLKL